MEYTQDPGKEARKAEIARLQKELSDYGIVLDDHMRTIRVTAGCVPEEPEDDSLLGPWCGPEPEADEGVKPKRRWKMGVRLRFAAPERVVVEEDHPYLSSQDGVLFNKDKTELIWYPYGKRDETYTVPHGVKRICRRAFQGILLPNFPRDGATGRSSGSGTAKKSVGT